MAKFKDIQKEKLERLKSFLETNGDFLEFEDEVEEYQPGCRRYTALTRVKEAISTISIDESTALTRVKEAISTISIDESHRAYSYFRETTASSSVDLSYTKYHNQHQNRMFDIIVYHTHKVKGDKPMFKYAITLTVFNIEKTEVELTFDNITINEMLAYFNELMNSFLVGFGNVKKDDDPTLIDVTDPVFNNPLGEQLK